MQDLFTRWSLTFSRRPSLHIESWEGNFAVLVKSRSGKRDCLLVRTDCSSCSLHSTLVDPAVWVQTSEVSDLREARRQWPREKFAPSAMAASGEPKWTFSSIVASREVLIESFPAHRPTPGQAPESWRTRKLFAYRASVC